VCTVSVISPRDGVLRLACNRDELLSRPIALPPKTKRFGAHEATLPIDPQSGGTWVALSSENLVFAILNAKQGWMPDLKPSRSRGEIIPSLLQCSTVEQAIDQMARIDAKLYGPFHLLIMGLAGGGEVMSDGRRVMRRRVLPERLPIMLTSSGLGDELVAPPRRELFDRMITFREQTPEAQDAFHRHTWPDRGYLSVRMIRTDARTVSYTVVELSPQGRSMYYHAIADEHVPHRRREVLALA
jgi:hypothetical protein